jgi:DNA polymerase II small subunit/DNA polymerase delta subunit B
MNHNHLRNLINLGYLVDESVVSLVENIDEDNFYRLIEGLKRESSFFITNELIKKILVRDVNIVKEFKALKKFTVQDFVKDLNERYSVLQSVLVKRVDFSDLVSINKIGNGSASIIGMAKDKLEREGNFIVNLEDPTGEIQALILKTSGEKLALDDVVAASGRVNNKILFVEKLVYPDVPLRPVNYTSESIGVAFLEEGKDCDANYVFHKGEIEDKIKNKVYKITNPCLVEIEGILILVLFDSNPLEVLRKRFLSIENTDFIIEPVPDIIFTDKDVNTNYKGITIVSLNKLIDLKNREVNNIS